MAYDYSRTVTIDYTKLTGDASVGSQQSRAGWSATASSYLDSGGNYTPSQAVTDNTLFWASNNEKPAHLIIDFGAAKTFDIVEIDPSSDAARVMRSWEIYVSDDGLTWGSAIKTGGFGTTAIHQIPLGASYTKQYLK